MTAGEVSRFRRFDEPGRSLRVVGEEELLRLLVERATTRTATATDVVLRSGDDAAAWRPEPGTDVVLTQDAIVEGEDFQRSWITPWQLGRRALAVAVSDLAASGAEPAWCMATVCAPEDTMSEDLLAIQGGILEAAGECGCRLLGGDVSRSRGPLIIDVSAGGAVPADAVLRRDAGRPGDLLAVTGSLGRAAAGLRLLRRGDPPAGTEESRWVGAQLQPRPRVEEGIVLRRAGVLCAGDLSDGVIVDASRTAAASACHAELWLEAMPVEDGLRSRFPRDWQELALGGGEDFELLVAADEDMMERLLAEWPSHLAALTVVGRLIPGSGVTLRSRRGGDEVPLPAVSSRHFS